MNQVIHLHSGASRKAEMQSKRREDYGCNGDEMFVVALLHKRWGVLQYVVLN